jgi:hypothetical protein
MTPEQTIALKLNPALKECHLHKRRIDYALGQLGGKLPLTGQQWQNLDDETAADIDQPSERHPGAGSSLRPRPDHPTDIDLP